MAGPPEGIEFEDRCFVSHCFAIPSLWPGVLENHSFGASF